VGLNLLTGADSTGVGYYSLFVAIYALGFSCVNFRIVHDRPLGVIWLYWSFLWFLFFLLLGLKRDHLTAYTGWVTAVEGWVTAAIPAFLILADVGDLRERGASGDHAGGLLRLGRRHDGGPAPTRPRRRAAASPAIVRSRIRSRSNSANDRRCGTPTGLPGWSCRSTPATTVRKTDLAPITRLTNLPGQHI